MILPSVEVGKQSVCTRRLGGGVTLGAARPLPPWGANAERSTYGNHVIGTNVTSSENNSIFYFDTQNYKKLQKLVDFCKFHGKIQ